LLFDVGEGDEGEAAVGSDLYNVQLVGPKLVRALRAAAVGKATDVSDVKSYSIVSQFRGQCRGGRSATSAPISSSGFLG
jgi:hypothetical protein